MDRGLTTPMDRRGRIFWMPAWAGVMAWIKGMDGILDAGGEHRL